MVIKYTFINFLFRCLYSLCNA